MFDIKSMMRPELLAAKEYLYARPEDSLWLDCNESPWDSAVNRYPQPPSEKLLSTLCTYYKVDNTQLLLTRGSDEGIDILLRLLCRPYQDNIIISSPTFAMYAVYAKLQGAGIIDIPLMQEQNFKLNFQGILDAVTPNTKIIFLCSPNNPTGSLISIEEMSKLCAAVEQQTLVVVDEAYLEFTTQKSMSTLLSKYSNLVVLRTLSKALGMAGLRMGIVIANAAIINCLKTILSPYLFPSLVLEYAESVITTNKLAIVSDEINYVLRERDMLKQQLQSLPMVKKIWESHANALFMQVEDAERIYEQCKKNKILIRSFAQHSLLKNCLRVSIGLAEQNQKFLDILQQLSDEK
ncbi:histidinol-phosphate transaminase [Candidatus Berkiella cookevillensis]|uniref:Histidinol-phosphate aminotransferase n=1 Tax=Candidatus Berkiella cookevillensis TaxID=437022 RepID=A0A0Q9YM49_9GAMM|nr:histidinol-phosphate transaminase [Candidatus Berkiella cookevillensis]MCS5708109.1 histidinol-phosphate transaminase [Candidatus Berkiella cookevillensis]